MIWKIWHWNTKNLDILLSDINKVNTELYLYQYATYNISDRAAQPNNGCCCCCESMPVFVLKLGSINTHYVLLSQLLLKLVGRGGGGWDVGWTAVSSDVAIPASVHGERVSNMHTHIHTAILRPFVRDYSGWPVPEETFTHLHPKRVVGVCHRSGFYEAWGR